MKPAAFSYHRARTLGDVFALLASYGDAAKVIAGGQSLGPMLNMRLAQPAHLIDLNGLHELSHIRDAGATLAVGALARHDDLARSELVRSSCPLLAEAAATVGHYAIRQRGTLGGSLAHADPAAQLPLVAVALGTQIDVVGPHGRRTLAARDFFVSVMTTALQADEIIVEVRFPKLDAREGSAFELFSRRHGDFAMVAVAATVALDRSDRAARVRLGVGGVDAVPLSLDEIARPFAGRVANAGWCSEIAEAARERVDPADDQRIPAAYRKELCAALTRRALERAIARARQN
ncbi:MAG TPA: FAD binding domain-containing protein [Casimicrobiaceae bacterium]